MENPYRNPLGFDDEQPPLGDVHEFGFQPQVPVMRRPAARPIGAFDQPILRENRTGIPTPVIAANNFEVKSSLITMVQNQRYDGLPLEDPLDHLDMFERLCRTVKMNGVPEDAIKMILFPFSLGNKASQWEKNVPSELVSTWDNVKKEFITKFYPKQKTAKLRNYITSFKQGFHENLYEAWERLKDYTRECPHHGVSKGNLLGIFYRGALEHYRRALDTASYGCFTNLTVEQGEQLIENFAQSEECYGGDYGRSMRDYDLESQRYKELNDKIDKLSKVFLVNQKAINYVGEVDVEQRGYQEGVYDGFQGVQEEDNYLGDHNYQGGYQNHPFNRSYRNNNLSYRSNNVENPRDQYYPPKAPQGQQKQTVYPPAQTGERDDMKSVVKQLMEGQARVQAELTEKLDEFERKIDSNHAESQAKFAGIYSHLKNLDNQIAQVASTSQRPAGSLPGKPETNPKAYCKTISLGKMLEIASTWDEIDVDGDVVQIEEVPVEESQEVKETSGPIKEKDEEDMVMVSYECSSIIKRTLPKKLADPGSFTLPCTLGSLRFPKCLCDLGSSVNLMPLSVAKKIGVTTFQKCRISLVLADRSVRTPVGIIENLPLRVGDHDVPTDFVVLEMDEEPADPLILGRPFLATAGALIDCREGKIGLQLSDSIVNFGIKRKVKEPDIGNQCFSNQTLDKLESKIEEEFCTNDPLKAAPIPEKEVSWSELKAPQTELKQLSPDQRGEENAGQKQGGKRAPIDRSPAIDRSIPSWKNWHGDTGSIEPAQIDRSKDTELCNPTRDRSIIFRSIDRPLDDTTPGETSKRAGKRTTASPTTWLNKKKAKMRMQEKVPPLQE